MLKIIYPGTFRSVDRYLFRSSRFVESEDHLQRQLNLPRGGRRRCDLAHVRNRRLRDTGRIRQRADEDASDRGGKREIGVVEEIKDFRAELKFGALSEKGQARIFIQ